jgi:5'-3' exonuclease
MSGDSTDGIPGLWRIGPKRAEKLLNKWKKKEWYDKILEMYDTEKYKPKKTCDLEHPELAVAMGRCIKILTTSNYNLKTGELTLWSPIVGL